ncbi:glutamine synthetase family protein [Halotalea alkalilenta]|uniref:glutamine synthetase family protein n=1 Tax=Halotalea alkalilenta TaxID=376489 RepID=UPI00048349EF|nr:glutamine synthetase family protein [Halotalea alkalilenta]
MEATSFITDLSAGVRSADGSEERTRYKAAFKSEVDGYLAAHPETAYVDVLLTDLNGIFRGKRLPVDSLPRLAKGCYFPASMFAMDLLGNVVEETGLGQEIGEPDLLCLPLLGTLMPNAHDPARIAQVLLTMVDEQGASHPFEPRNVLAHVWEQLKARGLYPVVAVELEFYLVDRERDAEGALQPPRSPVTSERSEQSQVYSLDNLDDFAEVLSDINQMARQQGLSAEGAVAEASPGQFEINLEHGHDVLKACDDALMLKRLIRQIADQHDLQATFMAKPYGDFAGNGMHIHLSLVDREDYNLFADEEVEDTELLHRALAGMIELMPASMALFAPNVNAFRRFQPGMYVPTRASWGYNNRTVALRIPRSGRRDYRIEHRVAGADANPYLVVAALLAGLLHGLDNALPLDPPIEGNGLDQPGVELPTRQSDALALLEESAPLARYLGEDFLRIYRLCKANELARFERQVTELELDWLLKHA